jgi:hypothetical protein
MSFLSAIVKPFTSIFHFLESPKGQAILSAGEGIVEAIDPALAPAITVVNSWMQKIFITEQLAEAAGQAAGTGAQKSVAVLTAIGPDLLKYFPTTTAANVQVINDAIVTIMKSLGEPAIPVAPPVPTP